MSGDARTIAYKLSLMTSCRWAFFLIWVRLQVLLIEGAIVSDCIHHQSLGCLRVEKSYRRRFTKLRLVPIQQLCLVAVHRDMLSIRPHLAPPRPLCLDLALKCSLSRLKCSQFLPEISNLFADSTQFGLGLFAHQIFRTKLCHYVQLKLAS